jgi:tRNA-specific 2-thiouridylase
MSLTVLAMSGGVDSSVAAHLLLETGHEVVGVFMRHGQQFSPDQEARCRLPVVTGPSHRPQHQRGCCTAEDAADARQVADQFDIPFYALNLDQDFDRIVDYFVDEYVAGRTPNPCVMCNHWIKFGRLFAYADAIGAQYVATGHYARLRAKGSGELGLHRGIDAKKDQSYVLFGVQRRLLARMLLPVGEYCKQSIRNLASQLGLNVAGKRDSQEICFVGPGRHAELVAAHREHQDRSGRILTTQGEVVGRHGGIERFTVGQRKGLGVALGEPYYVVRIDADSKDVVVGKHSELASAQLSVRDVNWLVDRPAGTFSCAVQIRSNGRAFAARVTPDGDTRCRIVFDAPCFGVAPGQAAVFYQGTRVLGGGWIE